MLASVFAFASGFSLFLAFYAGFLIMLSFPGFGKNTGPGSHALEPSQRTLKGFIIPNTYLRHRVIPPLAVAGIRHSAWGSPHRPLYRIYQVFVNSYAFI